MDRRSLIKAGLGLSALTLAPSHVLAKASRKATTAKPRTFVLVHGAFHGGWCWQDVADTLRQDGHRVFTPTLTGLGASSHLLSPNIGLETHIQDIVGLLDWQELNDVILVSHSYGGLVATGAADRRRDKIAKLIYVDAYVPIDGGSFIDARLDRTPEQMALDKSLAMDAKNGRIEPFPPEIFGVPTDHPEYARVAKLVTAHPAKTWLDTIDLPNGGADGFPKTFIQCTDPKLGGGLFEPYETLARNEKDWTYREIATGHDAMITAPGRLSTLILESIAQL